MILEWLLNGECPKCGYPLIKFSLDIRCGRCEWNVSPKNPDIKKHFKALKKFNKTCIIESL